MDGKHKKPVIRPVEALLNTESRECSIQNEEEICKESVVGKADTIMAKGTGTDPIVNSGPGTHDPGEAEQGSISQSIWIPISRVNRPLKLVIRLL